MLKNILKLNGAKQLTKGEQNEILGGGRLKKRGCCDPANDCCVPQPIPDTCARAGCASNDPNCQYAYGVMNCPDPNFQSCCI